MNPVTVIRAQCDPFEIFDNTPRVLKPALAAKKRGMYCKIQGSLVQFIRHGCDSVPPPSLLGRVIGQFSRASRLRLLKYLNKIDWRKIGESSFVTLTYPDVIDARRYEDRGKHRYLFLRKMESYFGCRFPCLWRIEWEIRKSGIARGFLRPHYHLCCFNVPPLTKEVVQRLWGAIIGYKNTNLQVDSRRVTGFQGCLRYIAKYVSKIPSLDIPLHHNNEIAFGRHWGTTRKQLIPIAPIVVLRQLEAVEEFIAMEWGEKNLAHYEMELGNGFTLMGDHHAEIWEKFLKNGRQPEDTRV